MIVNSDLQISLLLPIEQYHVTKMLPIKIGSTRYHGIVQQNSLTPEGQKLVFYILANQPVNDPVGTGIIECTFCAPASVKAAAA